MIITGSGHVSYSELAHEDVLSIARAMLGKVIATRTGNSVTAGRIVETEAYRGPDDKASHAYGNRRTARTEVMFGLPGHAYIYLCYGIHHMLNIVTGPANTPHAVLIRALEPLAGKEVMHQRRRVKRTADLCSGPGKLTAALAIHTGLNGTDLLHPGSPIQLLDDGHRIADHKIKATPRIGIPYAEEFIDRPWRFILNTHAP